MTLDDLLKKPKEKFSLAEAALVLAKEAIPELNEDFDVSKYNAKLDEMASELRQRIKGKEPEAMISEINKYLFKEQGFDYSANFFLNKVIDEKKGSCVGLSILYLALAERLKLPIYGIEALCHLLVRWDDGKFKRNIETTVQGEERSDSHYREKGVSLKNLSKKETIGVALSRKGSAYREKGQLDAAIRDYNKAIELNPNDDEVYSKRGRAYWGKACHERDRSQQRKYFRQAYRDLGPRLKQKKRGC